MQTTISGTVYSDIPTNLSMNPMNGDIAKITNETAIKRAIRNILLTDTYERVWLPQLGTNVQSTLFEQATALTLKELRDRILFSIEKYEPRVNILDVIVSYIEERDTVHAKIVFAIRQTSSPIEVDVFLDRVR